THWRENIDEVGIPACTSDQARSMHNLGDTRPLRRPRALSSAPKGSQFRSIDAFSKMRISHQSHGVVQAIEAALASQRTYSGVIGHVVLGRRVAIVVTANEGSFQAS